jgi:glycosyltransferase involved in cell wall biosynthesis
VTTARSGEAVPTPQLSVAVVAEQLRRRVPGGIGTYVACLVGGLAELSSPPGLMLIAGRDRHSGGACERFAPAPHVPAFGPPLPTELLTRLWDRRLLGLGPEGRRADVVHATSMAIPPLETTLRSHLPSRSRKPLLTAMVHDLAWRRFPESFPRRGRRWHEDGLHRLAREATAVVVPSEQTAGELASASAGWDMSRITVIPEGADHLPAPDAALASAFLRRLEVRGPYLLTVSTLEPRKNLVRLVAAYGALRPSLPEPWPLVVVGPPGWGPALAAAPGVVMAGHVDEGVLSGLYGSARAVAYVPLAEGFGLPAVEAMSAGAPVVVSSGVPSAASAVPAVDPFDVDAIAGALLRAATDESWRADLVTAGARHVAGLSWKETARRHLAWWTKLRSG